MGNQQKNPFAGPLVLYLGDIFAVFPLQLRATDIWFLCTESKLTFTLL